MTLWTASTFAHARDMSPQAAREAFRRCASGGVWNGFALPVEKAPGRRGGQGGEVWGLRIDLCPPELRALLGIAETIPSTSVERQLTVSAVDQHISIAQDKQQIIYPMLRTKRGSPKRAKAFRDIAAQPVHKIAGGRRISERTLRDWVNAAEASIANLIPAVRSDRDKRRVLVSRAWDTGIDLSENIKRQIAKQIIKEACSMVSNDGTSLSEARRVSSDRLAKYCAQHGSQIPTVKLKKLCKLKHKWAERSGLKQFRLGRVNTIHWCILMPSH